MEAHPIEPLLTTPFQIRKNRRETADTSTLELVTPNGGQPPAWRPGQFMMLYVFGEGEIPISISGDPGQHDALHHTVRAVGPVSRAIFKSKAGSVIGVRGPYGSVWPTDLCEQQDVVLVAGGIGLAPLRPVLYTIISDRSRYGRVLLLVGARTPDIILYRKEIETWRKRGVDVRMAVDAAAPGWRETVGPITTLIPRAEFDPSRAVAFIVGPEIMMRFVVQALVQRGIPGDRLFISMERNMKCAVGFCGHCQLGPTFICKDGPVFSYRHLESWLAIRNL
jgi:NAD(P)H-flavin reductase